MTRLGLRLSLNYFSTGDTSFVGSYTMPLRPQLLRADAPVSALSEPFPWPEKPSTARIVGGGAGSNTLPVP